MAILQLAYFKCHDYCHHTATCSCIFATHCYLLFSLAWQTFEFASGSIDGDVKLWDLHRDLVDDAWVPSQSIHAHQLPAQTEEEKGLQSVDRPTDGR